MSAEARLRYYAGVFDTVEVNSSYYAIPDPLNARRWAERTPPGFTFHVKAYPPEAIDATFRLFHAALAPLAEAGKLGYVLFQFAPWVRFSPARLDEIASLPARLPGFTIAAEFRDRSWFPGHAAETLATLAAARIAHVVVDAPPTVNAVPLVRAVTAPTAVLRLHGRHNALMMRSLLGQRVPDEPGRLPLEPPP